MDRLTFISKLVDALAWPFAVVVIPMLFRAPIIRLFPDLRRLRYKDFEVSPAQAKDYVGLTVSLIGHLDGLGDGSEQ